MMDLKKVKVAFIDVDGVLAIPRFKNGYGDVSCSIPDEDWERACNTRSDVYNDCGVNLRLIEFLRKLKANGTRLYVLTEVANSGEYFNKVDWVLDNYGEFFTSPRQVLFVNNKSKKVDVMSDISWGSSVPKKSCILVDDTYPICCQANESGFGVVHVSELFSDWWC